MSLIFIKKIGAEIRDYFEDFAKLRMTVFKEYPYLYEGSLEYELEYLETYTKSEKAFLFAVYDGEQMVGATTAIPFSDETEELKKSLLNQSIEIDKIFYFGESILLKEYRGLGLGHRFMDERESHAKSFKEYTHTAFCSVIRPEDHPLRPENYRPNDSFWIKRNYKTQDNWTTKMEWIDIDSSISTYKPMIFWMKAIESKL